MMLIILFVLVPLCFFYYASQVSMLELLTEAINRQGPSAAY